MAEIYLTLTEIEDFFQALIVSMLGWDESQKNNVRISWPTGGMPGFGIDDNVVFIHVMEIDSQYNRQRENIDTYQESPAGFVRETGYTRVIKIDIILYGPDSFENAQRLRDQIFYSDNRLSLSQQNMYLIPDIAAPLRIPELFEGQWWKRVDISMMFNELVVRSTSIPAIESMEVTVYEGEEGAQVDEINVE